jgi:hypothetical protein
MQTSPLVSPAASPRLNPEQGAANPDLQEPEPLELDDPAKQPTRPPPAVIYSISTPRDHGTVIILEV